MACEGMGCEGMGCDAGVGCKAVLRYNVIYSLVISGKTEKMS